ncbi:MAG: GNAT family N-acetyltransferase, partial [Bdellovibrionales bacterium]|nr:GNAT family N-acetyltransferase [Bdellovibrionales bacterium]
KGTMIDLELHIGLQKTILSGLVVDDIVSDSKISYLHIRLIPRVKPRIESIERRRSTRWICSDEFYPTAVASNPARFNEFVYFRIRDISSNGLKVQTSLRNKFIIPGMTFDCIVNFPMVSQIKMKFVVKTVRIELDYGKEVLAVGVTYVADKFITESVGQYLMQFGSVSSLQELRKEGFSVESVAQAVQFSYVRTKEDYDRVLQLRYQAYSYAGKLKEGAKPIDMADSFDSRARIVIGKYKGEIVASARLIFNQFEDKMEQESFVKWPVDLPRRDEMVEIMRACTHPDFRKSNLLMSLFRFIAITVTQSRRKWIVICATDDMIDLYKKIGFHKVGLNYLHSGLNNLKHNIMLANVPHAMEGRTVGPIAWNLIWSDVSSYLQEYEISEMDPIANIRLAIYRFFSPLAKLLYYMQKKLKRA